MHLDLILKNSYYPSCQFIKSPESCSCVAIKQRNEDLILKNPHQSILPIHQILKILLSRKLVQVEIFFCAFFFFMPLRDTNFEILLFRRKIDAKSAQRVVALALDPPHKIQEVPVPGLGGLCISVSVRV